MSSRSAGRGSEAARSIRLALRTSSIVAVSSASPSRRFLFWPGRRARIASPIVPATVAIPPTTQPHPLPIRRHASRRRLGCAAQETMGGERALPPRLSEKSVRTAKAVHNSALLAFGHLSAPCPQSDGSGQVAAMRYLDLQRPATLASQGRSYHTTEATLPLFEGLSM